MDACMYDSKKKFLFLVVFVLTGVRVSVGINTQNTHTQTHICENVYTPLNIDIHVCMHNLHSYIYM